MSKETKIAIFINGNSPPDLGFIIDWHDTYLGAVNSTALFSGYFKSNNSGGLSNVIVLGDKLKPIPNPDYPQNPPNPDDEVSEFLYVPNNPPVDELDVSNTDSFSTLYSGVLSEVRITGNSNLKLVDSISPLTIFNANGSGVKHIPQLSDGATIRMDGNGLAQNEVDDIVNQLLIFDNDENILGARPNMIFENNGNVDADVANALLIKNAGGRVWETSSGICKFQTTASTTISFTFFVNAGADVDWYLDGELFKENSNFATFNFTDNSIKTIEIRGTDVKDGQWLVAGNKSLTGTFDISPMVNASARIDFSDNPDLTRVILPRTEGIFDQLMGFNSGIAELRLDKLPGLINSANIQIRLGDCPNLDSDSVALNLLSIDKNLVTGRQFWVNGTTPDLSSEIKTLLLNNNWTVVDF